EEERPGVEARMGLGVEAVDHRVRMPDRPLQVEVVQQPRGRRVRARRQLPVARLGERRTYEAVAGVVVALVPEDPAELAQEARAQVALDRGGVARLEDGARGRGLARVEQVVC